MYAFTNQTLNPGNTERPVCTNKTRLPTRLPMDNNYAPSQQGSSPNTTKTLTWLARSCPGEPTKPSDSRRIIRRHLRRLQRKVGISWPIGIKESKKKTAARPMGNRVSRAPLCRRRIPRFDYLIALTSYLNKSQPAYQKMKRTFEFEASSATGIRPIQRRKSRLRERGRHM
eukprot:IDg10021t1